MSKLVRESVEKAEKILAKKGDLLDEGLKAELSKHLELAQTLSGDYRSLREEIKEKRLDIEENARALARAARKAKKATSGKAKADGGVPGVETASPDAPKGAQRAAPQPSKKAKA